MSPSLLVLRSLCDDASSSLAIVLLVAAGLVGCADDDAETDTDATVAAESSARRWCR